MTDKKKLKIGIFDSGLGGLTVLKSLNTVFQQQASFLYLGDLEHLPYGDKSQESIIRYSERIVNFFLKKKVDIIIVACHSASSVALNHLQEFCLEVPIVGTITPSVHQVINNIDNNKIKSHNVGVIGTETTINSKAYDNEFIYQINNNKINSSFQIESLACPLFVPIVEEGWENTDIAHQIATKYLSQFKNKDLDTIILACTHYPMLFNTLQFVFDKLGYKDLNFIDSGTAIANHLYKNSFNYFDIQLKLENNNINIIQKEDEFYVTDTPHQFNDLANKFLGEDINNIQLISL